jgi:hypothetical protein
MSYEVIVRRPAGHWLLHESAELTILIKTSGSFA